MDLTPDQAVNEEFCDLERRRLIEEISHRLSVHRGTQYVTSTERAVLWMADKDRLQELLHVFHTNPDIAALAVDNIHSSSFIDNWRQQFSRSSASGSGSGSVTHDVLSTPISNQMVRRSVRQRNLAVERDRNQCVVTRFPHPVEACHIYPFSLQFEGRRTQETNRLWQVLRAFWSPSRVNEWRQSILSDGIDSCANMITLTPTLHAYWNIGHFALKPIDMPNDRLLRCHFYWLRSAQTMRLESPITLSSQPNMSLTAESPMTSLCSSGHIVTFITDDPVSKPLPSLALLEMQWVLTRVVAMSAGAEYEPVTYHDDEDEGHLPPFSVTAIEKCVSWVNSIKGAHPENDTRQSTHLQKASEL